MDKVERIVRIAKIFWQVLLLSMMSLVGTGISQFLEVPIPGALIGMGILYLLLMKGYVKLAWIEDGAGFLIANLLLFFIPSAIGIIDYSHLFGMAGLGLLSVVVISIFLVWQSILGATLWSFKFKRRGYRL